MIRKSNFWYWTLFRPKYWASSAGLKRKMAKVDINSQVEKLNFLGIVPSILYSLNTYRKRDKLTIFINSILLLGIGQSKDPLPGPSGKPFLVFHLSTFNNLL